MQGRRFVPVAKELSKYKVETMMLRKPASKRLSIVAEKNWRKRLMPLKPLAFKLQTLPQPDTTWNKPLGHTETLPFMVRPRGHTI